MNENQKREKEKKKIIIKKGEEKGNGGERGRKGKEKENFLDVLKVED